MPGRKKRGSRNLKIMLSAMGITVLALLILALAAYLLIGGKAVSSGTESEQADQETDVNEEDPESLYEPEEQEKDAQRTAYLEKYSIHVVRIPNNEVTGNFRGVCEYIDSLVKQRMEAKDSR